MTSSHTVDSRACSLREGPWCGLREAGKYPVTRSQQPATRHRRLDGVHRVTTRTALLLPQGASWLRTKCAVRSLSSEDASRRRIRSTLETNRWHVRGVFSQVRVWSLDSVLDDTDESKPRLLATLTDHFGSVNVVRFSPDGRLLASGSDDKAVLIYKLEPSSGGAPPRGNFGSSDPPPLENWKLCQTLKVCACVLLLPPLSTQGASERAVHTS